LKFAKTLGDIVIVGVDADENVRKIKGKNKPIKPLDERMQIIASMESVDFVVPFGGSVHNLIEKLVPVDFLVKGSDYEADKVIGADIVGEVVICPLLEGFSTTKTIQKIKVDE